jgi:hypothetical protein
MSDPTMRNKNGSQLQMIEELQARIEEIECENRKLRAEKENALIQMEF